MSAFFLNRKGNVWAVSLFFAGSLLVLFLAFNSFFAGIDNWLHDLWLASRLKINSAQAGKMSGLRQLTPTRPIDEEITVILIDDRSILGIPGLFQGDREIYASAVRQLAKFQPRVIGLDVFFPAPSEDYPESDAELVSAVKEAGNTVLRAFRRDDRRMTPPFPALARATVTAPTYFKQHRDEAVRSVSLAFTNEAQKTVLSFQTEVFRIFKGLDHDNFDISGGSMFCQQQTGLQTIPLVNGEFMLLNYDVFPRSFRTFSFYDLLHDKIPEEAIRGKAVLVGAASSMTEEKHFTPIKGNEYSPFLNAITLRNLLNQSYLTPPPAWQGTVLAVSLLLLLLAVLPFLNPVPAVILCLLITGSLLLASFLAMTIENLMLDVSASIFATALTFIFAFGRRYYAELSEKMRIKTAFQHYVTASVVNEILKNPSKLNLHGEERNLTIFFSDIEGFTALSEGMSPLDVVSLLNEYLTAMTEIIFKFDGLLDKYEGDAIMAVFGAPVDQKDHAIRACRCALENQRILKKLREKWKSEGRPEIKVRIGINTGLVVVGNMGSTMRFDYTVIGDNVNLAARLETGNKLFNTEILVSEETAMLAESAVISRYLAKLKVAGKKNQVKVYEVLADRLSYDSLTLEQAMVSKTAYESALAEVEARNFAEAEKILADYLKENPLDRPAKALHSKIKGFLIVPPPPGWENVVTQDLK